MQYLIYHTPQPVEEDNADDIKFMVDVCLKRGFIITPEDAHGAWEAYSEDHFAGFLSSGKDEDYVFSGIKGKCIVSQEPGPVKPIVLTAGQLDVARTHLCGNVVKQLAKYSAFEGESAGHMMRFMPDIYRLLEQMLVNGGVVRPKPRVSEHISHALRDTYNFITDHLVKHE